MITKIFHTIFVVFVAVQCIACFDEFQEVKTTIGLVRGKSAYTLFENKPYWSFKGVPYAQPPLGELRFKPPVPKMAWSGVLDATEHGSICLQPSYLGNVDLLGDESCLYLNIYTPDVNPEEKLPVMFYIHGGGYTQGSGNDDFYGPDFIINEHVVLVTINYRLGPLGFLSLGLPEYSGNMGLKDQQLALKWTHENIANFGGDNQKITVFGTSAGGSSTHFHILSEESSKYFKRAIPMSGSVFDFFAMNAQGEQIMDLFSYATKEGSTADNIEELITFLNGVDAKNIINNLVDKHHLSSIGVGKKREFFIEWGPVVESKSAPSPFLLSTPQEILTSRKYKTKIDAMFGYSADEFLVFAAQELKNPELLKEFDEYLQIQLVPNPKEMKYMDEEYKEISKAIRDIYFGEDGKINGDSIRQYIALLSDVFFGYGINKGVKYHIDKSSGSTYYFRLSLHTKLNFVRYFIGLDKDFVGTSHADDFCYTFRCNMLPNLYVGIEEGSLERVNMLRFLKLWTNFAKYDNPTPNNEPVEFKPATRSELNFVDVRNEGLVAGISPNDKFIKFWDSIYKKYDSFLFPKPDHKRNESKHGFHSHFELRLSIALEKNRN